jgi:pimeloyl-ACP methyl ester carboxylesterase
VVLLEAGAFGFSADWAVVQDRLAARGLASLAYDRAGLGLSEPGPKPRDGLAVMRDLEALLLAMGESGPLILCGHSMAGLHVHLFAARHPERVVGLVLVDATTPASMDSRFVSVFVGQFAGAARLAAWGAGAGLLSPLAGTGFGDQIGLEGPVGAEKRWAFADRDHNAWASEEVNHWPNDARQAREAGVLDPNLPVSVVLAGTPDSRNALKALQMAPAKASRAGHVEHAAGATHATVLGGKYADAIVRGVEEVRSAAAERRQS